MSDELYDVILVENGKVEIVTLWKRIELERCLRIAKRESERYGGECGVIRSGTGYMGLKVRLMADEIRVPQFIMIDGKRIKQKDKIISALIYEKVDAITS